jgi:membrane-associated phospholipid phosphatase
MKIYYWLGLIGPLILIGQTVYLLWAKKILYFYLIGISLNTILNIVLKLIIQQPRPLSDEARKIFEISKSRGKVYNFNFYGMPSGHAQSSLFSFLFITLALKDMKISMEYLFISLISLTHRVFYKKHTVLQIIIGAIIGTIFSFLTFELSKSYIKGPIEKKEDDNAQQFEGVIKLNV